MFLGKLRIVLPQGTTMPLLSIYSKDVPSCHTGNCSSMLIADLLIVVRSWNSPKYLSTEEWIIKMCIYTMEHYPAIKNKVIIKFIGNLT